MRYEEYVPEIDYAARGYEPVKGRKNHFCHDCVDYYQNLHDQGKTQRPFPFRYINKRGNAVIRCKFDQALIKDKISLDDFDTQDEYETALRIADPVTWAWTELGWEPRWYQKEILNCTSQFKAVRAGRRVGKTEALTILIMWYAATRRNFEILVVCPYVAQVDKIFTKIREMLRRSPALANSVARDVRSSPQMIFFNNGSMIRGFASGSAKGSDQIRGQDADLIVIDEVDFIPDADIEVIMAILTSNKETRVYVSSTPTGVRSRLFEWSTDKDDRWKEFWYISAEGPTWDEEIEELYRSMYSPGGFAREFLAEFGDELEGVFRSTDIQKCIFEYDISACRPDHVNFVYTMGVDWNKITGTHIVVIGRPRGDGKRTSYQLVEKCIVRKSDFTQHDGVEKILELDMKWKPVMTYTDAGYGHTQMEMIWKAGQNKPHRKYRKRFTPIDMGGKTIILDPIDGEEIKKDTKPLMVYLAAHQVEKHMVMWPKSEDTAIRIIPEEVAFQEIGLVQQARNFKVTKRSGVGRETFSQDYEHTLTAWMLAIFAQLMEFGDYNNVTYDHYIGTTGPLGMNKKGRTVDMFDEFGQPLPPAMVQKKMEALRQEWAREDEERKQQMKDITTRRESFTSEDDNVSQLQYDDAGNHHVLIARTGGSGPQSNGSGRFGRRSVLNGHRRSSRNRRLRGRGF